MKVAVIGSRGIPAKYGGFEIFAEVLAERLVEYGHKITVYSISDFREIPLKNPKIRRVFIYTPKISFLEKVYMSSTSVLHSCLARRDHAIIFLGISGGLMIWLPRLLGIRTVINIDGIEWKRSRWGRIIKFALKSLERVAIKLATVVVADSEAIGEYVKSEYRRDYVFIPYGVESCSFRPEDWEDVKDKHWLERNGYYLIVGRHVPENNFDICIQGFLQSKSQRKLVIVSNLKSTEKSPKKRVIFTGPIYDRPKLYALRANASAYIHGHSVGGTNPSLLEAISSKNIVFAYDVHYNREVLGDFGFYFKSGKDLSYLIQNFENGTLKINKEKTLEYYDQILSNKYNWEIVIKKYEELIHH